MLSYPIDDAEALLSSKLATAKKSLSNCEEDLDFLREQITVRSISPAARIIANSAPVQRRWKLLLLVSTIGRWYKSARRRAMMITKRRKRAKGLPMTKGSTNIQ